MALKGHKLGGVYTKLSSVYRTLRLCPDERARACLVSPAWISRQKLKKCCFVHGGKEPLRDGFGTEAALELKEA